MSEEIFGNGVAKDALAQLNYVIHHPEELKKFLNQPSDLEKLVRELPYITDTMREVFFKTYLQADVARESAQQDGAYPTLAKIEDMKSGIVKLIVTAAKELIVPEQAAQQCVQGYADAQRQKLELQRLNNEIQEANKQLEKKNEELYKLVTHDTLTGIHSRYWFEDKLESAISSAQRHKYKVTLVMADIDHFKKINDTYGHKFGDHVLTEVAQTLETVLGRKTDHVARWGGEEFAIVLPDTDESGGYAVAQRMRKAVQNLKFIYDGEKLKYQGTRVPVTMSFGVKLRETDENKDALLTATDACLYAAKASGRNKVIGHNMNNIPPSHEGEF